MKLSDHKNVTFLVETRKRLLEAIKNTKGMISDIRVQNDYPDLGDFCEGGYNGMIGSYPDGSGPGVDLHGLYVIVDVAHATVSILEDKLAECESHLINLGVTLDAES